MRLHLGLYFRQVVAQAYYPGYHFAALRLVSGTILSSHHILPTVSILDPLSLSPLPPDSSPLPTRTSSQKSAQIIGFPLGNAWWWDLGSFFLSGIRRGRDPGLSITAVRSPRIPYGLVVRSRLLPERKSGRLEAGLVCGRESRRRWFDARFYSIVVIWARATYYYGSSVSVRQCSRRKNLCSWLLGFLLQISLISCILSSESDSTRLEALAPEGQLRITGWRDGLLACCLPAMLDYLGTGWDSVTRLSGKLWRGVGILFLPFISFPSTHLSATERCRLNLHFNLTTMTKFPNLPVFEQWKNQKVLVLDTIISTLDPTVLTYLSSAKPKHRSQG